MSLTDRVAFVTGASQGIGAALAAGFARAGASVAILARTEAKLNQVAEDIERETGAEVACLVGDVTDEVSIRDAIARTVDRFGRLDVAVNNASAGPLPDLLADIPTEGFHTGIDTNLTGTFYGMKHQIPAMVASGGGAIVNLASVAGVGASSHLSAYIAGKAGLIGLSKAAALDYADQGVRVNVVAPGPILTEHLRTAGPRAQQLAAEAVPVGRVGTVADVWAAVAWLCSAEASFVTGVVLPVDGGQTAGARLREVYRPGEPME